MHVHGPGLVGAHAPVAGRQKDSSHQGTVEMLICDGAQRFEGALDYPLGSNIFPWCRSVLGEHGQVFFLKIVECGPGSFHDVGGCHDHPGCELVGFEDGNGHTRLYHQGFVVFQIFERIDDGVVRFPVACAFADAAVDHQVFRCFGIFHVVFQHSQKGLLFPPLTTQGIPALGFHFIQNFRFHELSLLCSDTIIKNIVFYRVSIYGRC